MDSSPNLTTRVTDSNRLRTKPEVINKKSLVETVFHIFSPSNSVAAERPADENDLININHDKF